MPESTAATAAPAPPSTAPAAAAGLAATTVVTTVDSPIGPLTLVSRDGRLVNLMMEDQNHRAGEPVGARRDHAAFADVVGQLEEFFAGERTTFDVPMTLEGTEFQRRVWAELCAIPYGETISYGELARRVGSPGASRAVGTANGHNPVAVIVPCHRVIASDGTLGGYGGGLDRKLHLLDLERSARR